MSTLKFVNKNSIKPIEIGSDYASAIKVVAVTGYDDDWAAYLGPSDWSDDQVAEQGDKIDEIAAGRLFPAFMRTGRYYRE